MPELVKMKLNKDYKRRAEIIFGEETECDDTSAFKNLTLKQLEQLRDENFLDLTDQQNASPTLEQFMEFMKKFPGVMAHGYIVSPNRPDYRVTLEGLQFKGLCTTELQLEFSKLCRRADDLIITNDKLYCWFD